MNSNDIHAGGEPSFAQPAVPVKTLKDLHAIVKDQASNTHPEEDTVVHPIITDGKIDPAYKLPKQESAVEPVDEGVPQSKADSKDAKAEVLQTQIDNLRDEMIGRLIDYRDRLGIVRNLSQKVFEESIQYYNALSKLGEQFPREWDNISRLVESCKDQVRELTVGKDEHTKGRYQSRIDQAQAILHEPEQSIHYGFASISQQTADRVKADAVFASNIRPRYEHAINGAMQIWSQLPKDIGEVEEISSRAIISITRLVHDSAQGDTNEFQRQLIAQSEQYTQQLELITKELRNRLEDLNTDCNRETIGISNSYNKIMTQPA